MSKLRFRVEESSMKNYWLSWYGTGIPFTLHSPWWISGYRGDDDTPTYCAAVRAYTEDDAMMMILRAHDTPPLALVWRFVEERPADWSPYSDRFPKADWMPDWPPPP